MTCIDLPLDTIRPLLSTNSGPRVKIIPGLGVTSSVDQLTSLIPFVLFSDSGAASGQQTQYE